MTRQESGQIGEEIARQHLLFQGYTVLAQNFRTRYGEVDIIAQKDKLFVFVEVKLRRDAHYMRPADAVTPNKQKKLMDTAALWLIEHNPMDYPARFDVIEILYGLPDRAPRIHHIENAFP